MHPEKPVVSAGGGKDRFDPAGQAVRLVHPFEKARHRAGADGDVASDFDIAPAQLAWNDGNSLARLLVLDEKELGRQQLAEPTMQIDDRCRSRRRLRHAVFVDPRLNRDMRLGFELKVALLRIGAVVVSHRPFDVDGVGIMPLDEVAVVAVHRPHEVGERLGDRSGQTAAKGRRLFGEIEREVVQAGAGGGTLRDHQGLEQADRLAIVGDRHLSCFLAGLLAGTSSNEDPLLSYVYRLISEKVLRTNGRFDGRPSGAFAERPETIPRSADLTESCRHSKVLFETRHLFDPRSTPFG